jgi:hypothetical protein
MRLVHFDPQTSTFYRPLAGAVPYLPLCGDWGPTDTDITKEANGVTCPACREVMGPVGAAPGHARAPGASASSTPSSRGRTTSRV